MILLICGIKNWQTYNKTELETDTGNKQEVARGGKGEEQKRNRWRKLGSADFNCKISELEYEMNSVGFIVNTYII